MSKKTRPVSTRVTFEEFDKLQLHADAQGIYLATLLYAQIKPLIDAPPEEKKA